MYCGSDALAADLVCCTLLSGDAAPPVRLRRDQKKVQLVLSKRCALDVCSCALDVVYQVQSVICKHVIDSSMMYRSSVHQ
jgi:hypothetical protein